MPACSIIYMQSLTAAFKPDSIGSDAHLTEILAILQAKWPAQNRRLVFSASRGAFLL
jgi:hypothetical protein